VPSVLTKAEGITWLAHEMGLEVDQVAFIGDTNGDLPALEIVGRSFCPANGQDPVKARVDHASELDDVDAVIEAWEMVAG